MMNEIIEEMIKELKETDKILESYIKQKLFDMLFNKICILKGNVTKLEKYIDKQLSGAD